MKRICLIGLLLIVGVASLCFASDIQVTCEPGLRIYLDGEFAGISSAKDDGFMLMNIERGEHLIWVEKDGFLSQRFNVEILDLPIEVTVAEFSPVPTTPKEETPEPPEAQQRVGNLVVISAPQNCVVEIDEKVETKTTPQLSIGGLTAGEHVISFAKPGYETIKGLVVIQPGTDVIVRGNLKEGRVEVVHEGKGSLRVISTPKYCSVRFWNKTYEKTDLRLNISKIPSGEHTLMASMKGIDRSTKVWIKKGQRTIVAISFMEGDQPFVVSYEPE